MIKVFLINFIIFFIYISMALFLSILVVRNVYVLIHTNLGISFYINFEDVEFILISSSVISVFIVRVLYCITEDKHNDFKNIKVFYSCCIHFFLVYGDSSVRYGKE